MNWFEKLKQWSISDVYRVILNCFLGILAIALLICAVREVIGIFQIVLFDPNMSFHQLIEDLLIFFIYFEFVALIIKYFESDFHFPLRYFIYISVTAVTRNIIAHQGDALDILFYALAILLLVVSLFIRDYHREEKASKKSKKEQLKHRME